MSKVTTNQPRILHGPVDVGGQPWGFSAAFRTLGYRSETVVFDQAYFSYPVDHNLHLQSSHPVRRWWIQLRFLFRAMRDYDIFYFYFAQSLLPYSLDLSFLRLMGKRIFMIYQGCDIRLKLMSYPDHGRVRIVNHGQDCSVCTPIPDHLKRWRLAWLNFWAHQTFVVNPDLLFVSPRSIFLPYGHITVKEQSDYSQKPRTKRLIIAHAPSNRKVKGTETIIRVVEELLQEGEDVQLELIENKTHAETLTAFRRAGIIIDQIRIGWYGSVSVEAMALGVPVICYLDPLLIEASHLGDIPIISAHESNLKDRLRDLIHDRQQRETLSRQGQAFVRTQHHPQKLAQMLMNYW